MRSSGVSSLGENDLPRRESSSWWCLGRGRAREVAGERTVLIAMALTSTDREQGGALGESR